MLSLPVSQEILIGNIHLLLAAAIVLGFRWPGTWAFVLLTKVTPGVGLLWFAVRREWRSLGIALGATAAIVAVSSCSRRTCGATGSPCSAAMAAPSRGTLLLRIAIAA